MPNVHMLKIDFPYLVADGTCNCIMFCAREKNQEIQWNDMLVVSFFLLLSWLGNRTKSELKWYTRRNRQSKTRNIQHISLQSSIRCTLFNPYLMHDMKLLIVSRDYVVPWMCAYNRRLYRCFQVFIFRFSMQHRLDAESYVQHINFHNYFLLNMCIFGGTKAKGAYEYAHKWSCTWHLQSFFACRFANKILCNLILFLLSFSFQHEVAFQPQYELFTISGV